MIKKETNELIPYLRKIVEELHGIREKREPVWKPIIETLSIFLLSISLILAITNTRYLIQEKEPYVVWETYSCPQEISYGTWLDISLLNMGGSYTLYALNITTNGFKCFEDPQKTYNQIDDLATTKWNSEFNQTECVLRYMIAKDQQIPHRIIIFKNNDFSGNNASFTVSYAYVVNGKWTNYKPMKQCNYYADMTHGYLRWVLE